MTHIPMTNAPLHIANSKRVPISILLVISLLCITRIQCIQHDQRTRTLHASPLSPILLQSDLSTPDTHYCLTLQDGDLTNGNAIVLQKCHHIPPQQWSHNDQSQGYIRSVLNEHKCIVPDSDYYDSTTVDDMSSGTNLVIWDCPHETVALYAWTFAKDGSVRNQADDAYVMDVSGAEAKHNARVQVWDNLLEHGDWPAHVWHVISSTRDVFDMPQVGKTYVLESALDSEPQYCLHAGSDTHVELQECQEDTLQQQWHVDSFGYLHSSLDNTQCIVPKKYKGSAGTELLVQNCPVSYHDIFAWEFQEDGTIHSKTSGDFVMDVSGAKAKNHVKIQLWKDFDNYWPGHVWRTREVNSRTMTGSTKVPVSRTSPTVSPTVSNSLVMFGSTNAPSTSTSRPFNSQDIQYHTPYIFQSALSNIYRQYCLTLQKRKTSKDSYIFFKTCDTHSPYQQWTIDTNHYIHSTVDDSKCIVPKYLDFHSGTDLIVKDCPSQHVSAFAWSFSKDGTIQNVMDTTYVMDVSGGRAESNKKIQLWENLEKFSHHWHAQLWELQNVPVSKPPTILLPQLDVPFALESALSSNNNMDSNTYCLNLEQTMNIITVMPCDDTPSQQWTLDVHGYIHPILHINQCIVPKSYQLTPGNNLNLLDCPSSFQSVFSWTFHQDGSVQNQGKAHAQLVMDVEGAELYPGNEVQLWNTLLEDEYWPAHVWNVRVNPS